MKRTDQKPKGWIILALLLVGMLTISACDLTNEPSTAPEDRAEEMPGGEDTPEPLEEVDTDDESAAAPVESDVITETESMTESATVDDGEAMTDTASIDEAVNNSDTEAATESADMDAAHIAIIGMHDAEGLSMRASTLTGYDFTNQDGQISGSIDDFLVNVATGNVLFAFVEYGGLLEIGDTNLVMPLNAFRRGDGQLILNFNEQELESFPSVGDNWPNIEDPAWDDEVANFWRNIDIDSGFNFDETNSSNVMWLSEMMGYTLMDANNAMGMIQDVIVNLEESRISYLLFNDGTLAADEDAYLVPYSALDVGNLRNNEITFHSNVDLTAFSDAPRYDQERFSDDVIPVEELKTETEEFWSLLGFDNS